MICAKSDGTEGSWNAARVKLKFMKQQSNETVDVFYDRVNIKICLYVSNALYKETTKTGCNLNLYHPDWAELW